MALTAAEQVIEQFPADGEAFALLGAIEVEQNRLLEAVDQLEKAYKLGYKGPESIARLSDCYMQLASQTIDEIYLSWDYREIKDLTYQAKYYIKRIRGLGIGDDPRFEALSDWIDPPMKSVDDLPYNHYLDSYYSYINLYIQLENYSDAIAKLEEAVKYFPKELNLHNQLATLYRLEGKYVEALVVLQLALEQDPTIIETHENLAKTYSALDLPLHARNAIITIMFMDPEYQSAEEVFRNIGLTYGTWDDASFSDYGFRMILPPSGESSETLTDLTPEEGEISFAHNLTFINLNWKPLSDSSTLSEIELADLARNLPEKLFEIGIPETIGDPLVFDYNTIPIIYQPFSFINSSYQDDPEIGIHALWQCGPTIYEHLQLIAEEDTTKFSLFNPFLESITCDLESTIPEHP